MISVKISYIVCLIILLSKGVPGVQSNVGKEYAQLISAVYSLYDTSSVLIIHNDKIENVAALGPIFDIVQELSAENIPSLTANITQLADVQTYYYAGSVKRELFVIFIRQYEAMKEFEEIMHHGIISEPVWLIIFLPLSGKYLLMDYCMNPRGNPFNVAFNTEMLIKCYDDPIIREWYSVHKNETVVFDLAFWDPIGDRFKLLNDNSLYLRRNNIGGITLGVVTIDGSPLIEEQAGKLGGFFGKIIEELSSSMSFKIKQVRKEPIYGYWDQNKKEWSGIMKQLYEKNVDFAAADMVMSARRLKHVDFTIPLITSRAILCYKEPNVTSIQQLGYFKTFNNQVWSVLVVLIIIASFFLTTIKANIRGFRNLRTLYCENYLNVWRIFCLQGLLEIPKVMSLKLIYFSIFISAFITSSVYSATLISYLTVPSTILPFTSLEGFVKDGSYKLIVLKQSVHYDMFQETKDKLLKRMKKLMKAENELPDTEMEALTQVCNSKTAFYSTEETIVLQKLPTNCKLVSIKTGDINCLAMPISKRSQYTGIINFHLGRFLDNGMLQHFKYKKTQNSNTISLRKRYNVVTFSSIAPILKIVLIGVVFSIIVFIAELAQFYIIKNKG